MPDPIGNTVGAKVVENLVNRILDFILNPITARITVVRKCNENVGNLKNQVEKLKAEKEHVENYKMDVCRTGKDLDVKIRNWLDSAGKLIEAAAKLEEVGDEFAKKECFFRLCPNPIPRYRLSKEAEKNFRNIVEHLEVACRLGSLPLSHAPPPPQDVASSSVSYAFPTQQNVAALVEGFEEFPSRMAVLKQIMEALRNPIVNMIGLHGTSGVGKTMLVKMIKEKAKQDSLFTAVVMATVTKDRDLKSIQEDIARDLGLDQLSFREHTDRQVADLIKAKLMKVKKFLVVLDDVWETEIDFKKLGIPSAGEMKRAMEKENEESSSGQEDMLCSILLTSRFLDVLSSTMGENDQVFKVRELEDDEAWHLFKKIVGSKVENSDLQPKAKEIVEKCLGLPVAIASVGKAMKGKTQQDEWQTALIELRKPTPEGISAAVYKPIELSYDYLQGDELKQTFILCSLLGHDSSINDLLKYGMGLNLFQKVKTIEETRAKVLTLVRHLKHSSLLLDGHNNLHFGVHDQIREVALSIASRRHGVLALVDENVGKEWPEKETTEKLKWICLSNSHLELTSNGLKCPQLTFFHLSNKGCSLAVPTDLFTGAEALKVLCLTKIDFQSMPSQIPLIPTKLQTLILDQCVFRVEELGAIVGNLENLEVLSLAGCDIEELPREMEKLTKLKLLDLSDCTKLKVIPRQVLARMSKLEELKMGNSFDQWDGVEEGNARLAELIELHMLTALEVRIPNFQEILFQETLFLENLERFKIFIGREKRMESWLLWESWRPWDSYSWDSYSWESSFESSKIMKLKLQGASITSNHSIRKFLKKTEELYLEGLNGVESLVDQLDDEGFQHLKCLQVQNAPDIRRIFNQAGRSLPSHVFPILEELTLCNLEKMEKICHGLTGAAPFKVLRKITVHRCHELKNLFSFSVARKLLQLQEITVEDCDNFQQVIDDVEEQGNGNDIVEESEGCKLGSLRSLTLDGLPKLISFNSNCSDISLFNDKVVFPKLEELKFSGIKINQLWVTLSYVENPQGILDFKKLKYLQISKCSSLEYLFTPSMVSSLTQLEDLSINSCEDLKQVIMVKGIDEEVKTELIFPRLNFISLWGCSNFSSFYVGSYAIKFKSAIKIYIHNCPNMITFASTFSTEQKKETAYQGTEGRLEKKEPNMPSWTLFHDAVEIPLLDSMHLSKIGVQQIWHGQITSMSSFVENLKKLSVWSCDDLKFLFTSSMVESFKQLEVLTIGECVKMQVVILIEESVQKGGMSQKMFPKLDTLKLSFLPQLIRFCSNFNSLGEVYKPQGLAATQSILVETEITQLVFPQVTCLKLERLQNFKGFFPQIHITKWPLLKRMNVERCHEVKTFASEFSSIEIKYGDNQLERQTQDPMFWISKDSFPCLEELEFKQNDNMNEIWHGQSPRGYFPKLKDIKLQFQNDSAFFPSFFFQTLPSLENLVVSKSSFHEIFQCERLNSEVKSIFYNLRTLQVLECIKLVNLVPSVVSFENLQALEISKCHGLKNLVSYSTAKSLEQLKRMSITDCDLVEEIVGCLEDDVKDGIVFHQLKYFQLCGLPRLASFCATKCDFEFPSLKEVIVMGCPQMKYFSMGKTVTKELQNIQWINDEEKGHWLCDLNSTIQDLFTQKVGYFGSRKLKLTEFSELIEIWKKNPEGLALPCKNLQYLEVSNCSKLSYLLIPSMVLSLVQLKDLKVKDCATMEQVIMVTGVEGVVETDLILFPQLKSILLESCSKLSSFYKGSNTLKFPMLEEIIIKDCLKMVRFASQFSSEQEKETADGISEEKLVKEEPDTFIEAFFCDEVEFPNLKVLNLSSININQIWNKNHEEILSFKNLQQLEVCNCSSLSYLLTPSMALGLVQLEDLKVKDCATIEQVIMAGGVEEAVETGLIFPQLNSILLESCSKLSSFYVGSNTLKFPMLKEISVKNCLKRVRFGSKFLSDKEKKIAYGRSEETHVKEEPDIFREAFFCDEVKIPILDMLTLSSINIKEIWSSQLSSISSFAQHLTKLKMVNCSNLKYLFTFSMVKSFVQLEELGISGCEMMEVVIMIEGMVEEEKICQMVFSKLETLVLNELPQLATFCSNCDSLGEISDFSTGSQKRLATELTLVETKATKVVFSQVKYLILRLLPKFKSFFLQTHITEWPSLKRLVVIECYGAQIVASEFSSIEMTHGDNQLERESQHLMFWISKATFPRLESLVLNWNDNIKIQCGHHPEEYFGKLKVLHLLGFPNQSAFLLPFFFHSLPNLEKLLVKDALFDEIFQCEEVTSKEKPICGRTPFSKLRLSKLYELTHLWKEESQLEADILNNLTTLKVQECSKLKNLVPSTVHFDSLQTLVVFDCHGLVNLVRYSTAKSLVQLKRMKVANCKMIEEIVVCLGDAAKDGIVFTKLECLQLKGLPRLESFCSGICNFKFPALGEVIVTECPNMQTFSKGELSTPELHEVKLTGDIYEYVDKDIDEDIEKKIEYLFNKDEGVEDDEHEVEDERCWVGNLNSTIQQLFKEKRGIMEKYECQFQEHNSKLDTSARKSVSGSENEPTSKDVLPLLSVDRGIELGLEHQIQQLGLAGKSGSDGENDPTSENVLPAISVDRGIEQDGERKIQELSSKLNTSAGKSGNDGENDPTSERELPLNLDKDVEQGGECQIQELGSKLDTSAGKSGSHGENDPTSEGGLPLSSVDRDIVQGGERQIQELRSKLDTLAGKSVNYGETDRTSEIGLPSISVDKDIEQGEEVLKELPNEEEWQAQKSIRAIVSLPSILPESPKCLSLVALSLEGSNDLMSIPSSFFEHMPVLQSLNLSSTSIRSLPMSLSKLVALKMLILRRCKLLMELSPQVGDLHNLEKLDLDETEIVDMPKEIGKLSKLKILRLSFYGDMSCGRRLQKNELIHCGTIKTLSHLTELSIDVNPDDERWDKAVEIVIEEACSLKSLKCLVLYLPNVEILGKQGTGETSLISYTLCKFRFIVGQYKQRIIPSVPQKVEAHFRESDKCLKFVKGEDIPGEMKMLLKKATAFYLDRHYTARSLCDFGTENMQKLEFCLLTECNEIQTIINGEDAFGDTNGEEDDTDNCESKDGSCSVQDPTALSNLQYLHLYYMENFVSIWSGATYNKQCLSGLKLLTLHMCPKLSVIFTPALLANLQKLEVLIVEDCAEVTSLVTLTSHASVNSAPDCFLPSLKTMLLLFLPKLKSISSGLCIAPKLENVGFYDCPELKSLSIRELSSENLKVIKGESEWWEALEWNNDGNRIPSLDGIFSPIDENYDLMKQMEEMQGVHESRSDNLVYQDERDV